MAHVYSDVSSLGQKISSVIDYFLKFNWSLGPTSSLQTSPSQLLGTQEIYSWRSG